MDKVRFVSIEAPTRPLVSDFVHTEYVSVNSLRPSDKWVNDFTALWKEKVKITAHGYDMYGNPKSECWCVTQEEADVIETIYPGGPW